MEGWPGSPSYDQLPHSIGAGLWDRAPLEATFPQEADQLVGGNEAWPIINSAALPKKGQASVGVSPQCATTRGENTNCQMLGLVTLASDELSLKVFGFSAGKLDDAGHIDQASEPAPLQAYQTQSGLAIEEIDRVIAVGLRFDCVLADAGYGQLALFGRR